MPWLIEGRAGAVVQQVKAFLSGQWLCDRLGASGTGGCGHSLVRPKDSLKAAARRRESRKKVFAEVIEGHQGKGAQSGQPGVVDVSKRFRKGLGEAASTTKQMGAIRGFWNDGCSSSERAFQPGGDLHFLAPLLSTLAFPAALCQESLADVHQRFTDVAVTSSVQKGGELTSKRSRRSRKTGNQSSSLLTVSVRSSATHDPKRDALVGDLPTPSQEASKEVRLSESPKVSSRGEKAQRGAKAPAESNPSESNSEVTTKEEATSKILPQGVPLQGVQKRGQPGPFQPAGEKRGFQIPNPLEAITRFVEEARDLMHAAAGKKRPPSKASVAAWEEKALAKSLLRKKHASLVMFYSKKCQLCKSLTPMVNEMAKKESWWLDVCYLDVDNQSWMPEVVHYDITYVPCFMYLTPSGMAMAKTGAPHSKRHVLDGLQKVMSGAHPECKLARRRLADMVRQRQKEAYAKAKAEWQAQKKMEQEKLEIAESSEKAVPKSS